MSQSKTYISITRQIIANTCACLILILPFSYSLFAQVPDSTTTLKKVTVRSVKQANVSAITPMQSFGRETLQQLNAQSVGDAARFFAGVNVKDYGGIGGLKTVSVRSLGANHTGVMYDGILLTDAQAGQIDLSKLSLDNLESITLYNGQPTELLTPARSYSPSSVMVLKTITARADTAKKVFVRAGLKAGSFGFINPAAIIQYQVNKKFYNSVSAEWQRADGIYPFKAYESGGGNAKRKNSDIDAVRLEYDADYKMNDSDRIHLKAYYYNSDRGLPGAIIVYNTLTRQRLTDKNFFGQVSWKKTFTSKSSLLLSGKYALNYRYYLDPDFPNSQGMLENEFHQQEIYLSGAYEYKLSPVFSFAYSSDFFRDKLTRTDAFALNFPAPVRNTWLNNLAVQTKFDRLELQANLLYTLQREKINTGAAGKEIDQLAPAIAAAIPIGNLPLKLRAFYKNTFRTPTFNDLYYTFVGNTNLRPEYAKQYNIGMTYRQVGHGFLQSAAVTVDAYYNTVKDKILAVPRENLFQWSMLNIGKAAIKGIDATVQLYGQTFQGVYLSLRLAYSFQQALDVSDRNSPLYRSQLPYTPEHSGSINLNARYKAVNISYNVSLSGYRYRIGEPIPGNLVKEWSTHDVSASYHFFSKNRNNYKIMLELNNVFNQQYEIIRYYPMPRFNYRIGVSVEF